MNIPVEVAFKGMPVSDAAEAAARRSAEELELYFGRITSCRVVIDAPHRRHHQGALYSVRIDLTMPGAEIVVNREHRFDRAHEDVYVAMRDAFAAARRRLEDQVRLMRHQVKSHAQTPAGHVVKLVPARGYGFLATPDGREVYFHRHALVGGGFERLHVGDEVRFAEEPGREGPQATFVHAAHAHAHGPGPGAGAPEDRP
jgi:cold shock CspA family protein